MSYVIDAASKINEVQLKAVTEGQNAVVELVRIAAEYIDRTPEAPEPVQKLVEPGRVRRRRPGRVGPVDRPEQPGVGASLDRLPY